MSILEPGFMPELGFVKIVIAYNGSQPIAVRDFTASLDGMNDLYTLFSQSELIEKEGHFYLKDRDVLEDQQNELHIVVVEKGSIAMLLTDPQFLVGGVNFVASLITIFGLFKKCPKDINANINLNINLNLSINLHIIIDCLMRLMKLIKTTHESITFKDSSGEEIRIDFKDKKDFLDFCKLLKRMGKI